MNIALRRSAQVIGLLLLLFGATVLFYKATDPLAGYQMRTSYLHPPA